MRDRIDVQEIDNRPHSIREEDERQREGYLAFDRQLRRQLNSRRLAWEQGFIAGLEASARLEEPHIARGTRDLEDLPTAPYPIIDIDLIMVD